MTPAAIRDQALMANFVALRLQVSRHAFDRSAAPVVYEVARIHYAALQLLAGRPAGAA